MPDERILVLTNVDQEAAVRELLPDLPPENILAEPAKRDTAAAVALATAWVAARDHRATMMVLPADHVIKDRAAFQKTMQTATRAAEETGALVTIGIKPTWACPGFGYIEQGGARALERTAPRPTTFFASFAFAKNRTPNWPTASSARDNFRWNAGMFVWSVPTVLSEFNRHAPELADFISQIRATGNWEHASEQSLRRVAGHLF